MTTQKKNKKFRKSKKQLGEDKKKIINPEHPLSYFIKKKKNDKYFLVISKKNVHLFDIDNIYIKCFLEKLLVILRISFEREKQYHISKGNYPSDYNHQISTILGYIKNPNYITAIGTDAKLEPFSYLHVERKQNDFDKIWTVCTHPESRGKGYSSFVLSNVLRKQRNDRRKNMLLEVYNDDIIGRKEYEPKQRDIMEHFSKHGFNEVSRNGLSSNTVNQLISRDDETKIMICNL